MDTELALRLREALGRSDLAVRAFARELSKRSGHTIESERGHLNKALGSRIETVEEETSVRWVEVLNEVSDDGDLPPNHFVIPVDRVQQSRRSRGERLEAVEGELGEVKRELGEIRQTLRQILGAAN